MSWKDWVTRGKKLFVGNLRVPVTAACHELGEREGVIAWRYKVKYSLLKSDV